MILALTLVTVIFLYVYIKYRFDFWTNRGFPSAKPSFPFGNISGVGKTRTLAEALNEVYNEFKGKEDFVGAYFFTNPVVLIINPELAKYVLVKDFNYFSDRGMYSNKITDPLSFNIVSFPLKI